LEIADADAQGYGHIIITPFGNQAMALIRYDVGDLGKLVHKPCPCGRTLPRLELAQGRVTDVIKTPSGKVVTSVFFDYIGRGLRPLGLRQFRAIQKSDTHFLLQLAQNQSNSAEIELSIRNRFREYLGSEITVDFEYVEAILPEKTGKLRYFYKLGD
jgi:phenylacetate-CoA ligase